MTTPSEIDRLLEHAGWARALARTLVRDAHAADDLVQRTWLFALERPPEAGASIRGWIGAVLRNFVRADRRTHARRVARESAVARPEGANEAVNDDFELQRRLFDAVRALDEPYRSTLWARYYEGLMPREIARRDGLSVAAVKSRLQRGVAELRARFDREHGGDRRAWVALFLPWSRSRWPVIAGALAVSSKLKLAAALVVVVLGAALVVRSRISSSAATDRATAREAVELIRANDTELSDASVAPPIARDRAPITAESIPAAAPRVTVRVIDMQRNPIVGAHVTMFADGVPSSFEADASGQVVLPIEPREGAKIEMDVEAAGFFHAPGKRLCEREVEIQLARTTTLRGQVLERGTGRPIAAVRIEHKHQIQTHHACAPETTVTDAGGRFSLAGIPVGASYDEPFTLSADGFPQQRQRVRIQTDGPELEHDFFVDAGVEITGQVVDFTTNAPIAGARLLFGALELARTRSDGRFEARCAAARSTERIALQFAANGYCSLMRDFTTDELGPDHPLRATLPRPARIRGTLRDEGGSPVPGFAFSVRADSRALSRALKERDLGTISPLLGAWTISPGIADSCVTDESGAFETPAFLPYTPLVTLSSNVTERGRVETRRIALGAPGETAEIDLVLRRERYGTIAGRILLNGKPAPGEASWRDAERWEQVQSDAEGRFVFENVAVGRVAVTMRRGKQRSDALASIEHVDVEAGTRVERDFDLAVALAPIAGRVLREDGSPVAGTTVYVDESPDREGVFRAERSRTDADGRFETLVPVGDLAYSAFVISGGRHARDGLRAGDRNVEIVVAEKPIVFVRAVDVETREPIAHLDVYARADGGERFAMVSEALRSADSSGWLGVSLAAGDWTIHVRPYLLAFEPVTRAHINVTPRGETRIELELSRAATLELRLASGASAWSASNDVVLLERALADAFERAANGTASFADLDAALPGVDLARDRRVDFGDRDFALVRGLAPGAYRLVDRARSLAFEPAEIDVRAAGSQRVDVRWRRR